MLVVARSLTFTPRPMRARIIPLFLVLTLSACASVSARSSGSSTATRAAVMAVVDSALLHINSGDLIALSDLMIPEAMVFPAQDQAQIMLVTDQAKMIRMKVSDMRVIGRNTAGVRLFDVADKEQIVSAALIEAEDDPAEDTDIIDATSPDEAIGATEAE